MLLERSLSVDGWPKSALISKTIFDNDEDDFDYFSFLTKPSKHLFLLIQDVNEKLVRWPIECQFSTLPIQHISYVPFMPEPFYAISGKEEKPIKYTEGIVVYRNPVLALSCYQRSTSIGFIYPTCPLSDRNALRFESRFECGNLERAVKIHDTHYELYLRNDMYTSKYIQWFYFRVSNMMTKIPYRFSIVNFNTENMLYKEGLKPLMYSVKDANCRKVGWRRCGSNIAYYSNKYTCPEDRRLRLKYSLTFTITFTHDNDTVYFAYCYPYTYSNLQNYLLKLASNPVKSKYASTSILCQTLAGNNLYCVTITSPANHSKHKKLFPLHNRRQKKKVIVITARVHPSETPSSWVMKGFIDFLTGPTNIAKVLRDKFIFKLIPMLNPDGVIIGNTRCSLTGTDLNRQYKNTLLESHPTIWYTKLFVEKIIEKRCIAIYCDLHAHANSHDVFLYGCENAKMENCLEEQTFAVMFKRRAADLFCLDKCKYEVDQKREGTARVAMGMIGIPLSFTLEASFGGSRVGANNGMHYTVQNYEAIAQSFCETIFDYFDNHPRTNAIRHKIKDVLKNELVKKNEQKKNEQKKNDQKKNSLSTSEKFEKKENDSETLILVQRPQTTKNSHVNAVQRKRPEKRKHTSKASVHKERPEKKNFFGSR